MESQGHLEEEGTREKEEKRIFVSRIGRLFRAVRRERNYSQKQLAKVLEISQGFLSKIESEVSTPDIIVWLRFCRQFDLSPNLILDEKNLDGTLVSLGEKTGRDQLQT